MKSVRERVAKYRKSHREKRLCVECSEKVIAGRVRCLLHLKKRVESQKVLVKKRKKLGKCSKCGMLLHISEQGKHVVCSVCGNYKLQALRVLVNKGIVGYNKW